MFNGFSKQTADFLWELSFNNERPWFLAHREDFERALHAPFKALAHDLYEEMSRRFPDEELRVHLSRIYRDARRLFGRGPYKDHLWFTITPLGAGDYGPTFWFEIGAAEYSYGLGFWAPGAATMEALRDLGEIINPWYNRKYLDFGTRRDHDALLYSPDLVAAMARDFEKLMPLCRFMADAARGVPPKEKKA